mgnify:CR=1 FL=1
MLLTSPFLLAKYAWEALAGDLFAVADACGLDTFSAGGGKVLANVLIAQFRGRLDVAETLYERAASMARCAGSSATRGPEPIKLPGGATMAAATS